MKRRDVHADRAGDVARAQTLEPVRGDLTIGSRDELVPSLRQS